jgi:hypothetical protein
MRTKGTFATRKYRCPRQKTYGDDPLFDAGGLNKDAWRLRSQPAYPTALIWYRTDIPTLPKFTKCVNWELKDFTGLAGPPDKTTQHLDFSFTPKVNYIEYERYI